MPKSLKHLPNGRVMQNLGGSGRGNRLSKQQLIERFDHFYAKRGGFLMLLELYTRGWEKAAIGRYFGFYGQWVSKKMKQFGFLLDEQDRGAPPKAFSLEEITS